MSIRITKIRKSNKNNDETEKEFLDKCATEFVKVGPNNFFNMNQTFWKNINLPISTFTYKGNKTTGIIYNDKAGFTFMLCICTNGDFLKPIIIKKGKTFRCLSKVKLPENFIGCYSNNGWINRGIMKVLFE
jgi:hypothetical protein